MDLPTRLSGESSLENAHVGHRPNAHPAACRKVRKVLNVDHVLAVVSEVLKDPQESLRRRQRNSWSRAIAVRMLCRYAGCTRR